MARTLIFAILLVSLAAACSSQPRIEIEEPPHAHSVDGNDIFFTVAGSGKTALVFVHCWSCDRTFWADQVERFQSDYRVVAIDLPGHGASGQNRPGWALPTFGEDVKAVVDSLGLEQVILVGHSMGAPASLEAAKLMPQRVKGVIAIDSLHNVEFEFGEEQWQGWIAAMDEDFTGFCGKFVQSMFLADGKPEVVADTTQRMCDAPPEIATQLFRQFKDYDIAAAMSQVKAPIRCINAPQFPTAVDVNRKYAADFDAVIIEGTGHFPMFDRPDEFNRLLTQVVRELTAS